MYPQRMLADVAISLLILGCAFFAAFDLFAFAFAIGDGSGQTSFGLKVFLTATLVGTLGLLVSAIGTFTKLRAMRIVTVVSASVVLPAAIMYGHTSVIAMWANSKFGIHYGVLRWAAAISPPFLDVAAIWLSTVRWRKSRYQIHGT